MLLTDSQNQIGLLVVAHGDLAQGLVGAATEILGEQERLTALRIDPQGPQPGDQLRKVTGQLDSGSGVLALTDLFGGTPANVALAVSANLNLEVVTGANLPMLLRALSRRSDMELHDLATEVAEYGCKQILTPNDLLPGKKSG